MDPIITKVNSLEEALKLAEIWKSEGKYDLFRGQAKNWDVISSLHRLSKKEYLQAKDRITMFYSFVSENKFLQIFLNKIDELFAIAQHYGIPTNYIDFSTEPKIAAYFATNSNSNTLQDEACIVCLNSDDFKDLMVFGEPYFKKHLNRKEQRPSIISVSVANLWRLESQHGKFLYTPFIGIEEFYRFNRIVFPFKVPFTEFSKQEIYPSKKSNIEIYLDHYFEAERRSNTMSLLKSFFSEDQIKELPDSSIFEYIHEYTPKHFSWQYKNIKEWLQPSIEEWGNFNKRECLRINIALKDIRNFEVDRTIDDINDALSKANSRHLIFNIKINRHKIPFNKKVQCKIDRGCNIIWDGMRLLPYTNRQIATSLARFIFMISFDEKESIRTFNPLIPKGILVEMTNRDGANSRAYVSGYKVLAAKRKGISKYFREEYKNDIDQNPVVLLQLMFNPKYLFRFEWLCQIFVEDVIPSQTVMEINDKNPAVYFNVAYLDVFGLA